MKLQVDHREPEKLKQLFRTTNDDNVTVEFTNLPAGDFAIINETGAQVFLVERKEIADLCSSLTDGRFDDQKSKLSSSSEGTVALAYLIEGNYSDHPKERAIDTVVLTTRFRDGFFVLRTENIQHTYEELMRIYRLYQRGKMDPLNKEEQHKRFIASRAAHRGGSKFSKAAEWWTVSLAQIPGIGPQAARAIAGKYPTVKSLLDAYHRCKTIKFRREMLQDLKGGTRRIGPKASERVWRTVVGDGDDRKPYAAPKTTPPTPVSWKQNTKKYEARPVTTECLFIDDDE